MTAPARVVAGIDVGNATTEVVLADVRHDPPRPLAHDRAPTRGRKGSAGAARAAAELAARTARRAGLAVDAAALAPQRAVDTTTAVLARPTPDLAPLVVVAAAARTPGRPGVGAGRPVPAGGPPATGDGPVVVVVDAGTGYRDAVAQVRRWLAGGARVAAVAVAGDEGVLVARRLPDLPAGVPVVDGVDAAAALRCRRLLVEVAGPDAVPVAVTDPLRLVATFALDDAARPVAVRAAAALADTRNAVVGLDPDAPPAPPAPAARRRRGVDTVGDGPGRWQVDLDDVVRDVEGRRGPDPFGAVVAVLDPVADAGDDGVRAAVEAVLDGPAAVVGSEGAAARAGALSTPGARPDALVLDLGGGTLDLVLPDGERVVAGAGELVTAGVARLLGITRGAADWVKRGPCARLDGPHVLAGEDGERRFADRAAPAGAVGSLVVPGPAGWLPFSRSLAPAEWRALRLRLKRAALGDNVARLVAGVPLAGRDVVLVGGAAGDAELLRVLDGVLAGAAAGRADVAAGVAGPGALGHRWAVAYGLTVLAGRGGPS